MFRIFWKTKNWAFLKFQNTLFSISLESFFLIKFKNLFAYIKKINIDLIITEGLCLFQKYWRPSKATLLSHCCHPIHRLHFYSIMDSTAVQKCGAARRLHSSGGARASTCVFGFGSALSSWSGAGFGLAGRLWALRLGLIYLESCWSCHGFC